MENIAVNNPKINALFFETLPVGIGLKQVLFIKASISDSYHIFKVPAAPAPNETAINETIEDIKLIFPGAINIPTIQVNKTKDITLGFISLTKDLKLKELSVCKFFIFKVAGVKLFNFRKLFKSMKRRR